MAIKETCLEYLKSSSGKCCGCGSCFNICPTKAISMVHSSSGFLEPTIDDEKCIHCGICKNACPIFNHVENKKNSNTDIPTRFVFSGSPEILSQSSSGGAFSYIANKILSDGGYIVGAAYNDDFSVHHIIIDNTNDLNKLRLSKYVQSNQEDCYVQVKNLLVKNKNVLYTGTPCQIAGLKCFLRHKDYPNLYTIDILCHGVPSYKLLREYLDTQYGIDNISEIFMRKKDGWAPCLDVKLKDNTVDDNKGSSSVYMHAFLKDIILRNSCYGCMFASLPRYGDITIGDCWNARKLKFQEPFNIKSSIVLVNNNKGRRLWDSSLKDISDVHIHDISSIDKKFLNANIYKPNAKHTDSVDTFWENYKNMNFTESYLKTIWGEAPVGLLLYASNNYGSCATNLALYIAIERMGYTPVILDSLVPTRGVSKTYLSKYCKTSMNFLKNSDIKLINRIFSSFVVGSDYSFNINAEFTKNYFEYLCMAFVQNNKNKIAFAPSLGLPDFEHDDNLKFLFKYMLRRFDFLSLREEASVEHIKKHLGVESQTVLDPVFLIDKDVYLNVAKQSKLNIPFEYILVYILDTNSQKVELVKKYEKLFGLKKFVILDLAKYDKNVNSFTEDVLEKLPFEDFIYYFINAKFIITDSFHGTCFSLIFNKKFVSIKNRNRKRFDTLQDMFKGDVSFLPIYDSVNDAYVNNIDDFDINFVRINDILKNHSAKSNLLLKQALMSATSEAELPNDNSIEINMQYIKLWRNYCNVQKQLKNIDNSFKTNASLDLDYDVSLDNLWKNISSKLLKVIPSFLLTSKDYSKHYYKIYIKGINKSIHFEFLIKDNKPYFCFHCESIGLKKYCKPIFENVKKMWSVEEPASLYKLNKPILDISLFDIEAFNYIDKSIPALKELLTVEQLRE